LRFVPDAVVFSPSEYRYVVGVGPSKVDAPEAKQRSLQNPEAYAEV
jgi:hypothetical protein